MATSSITANFHTDDPKAANAIVHALFTVSSAQTQMPDHVHFLMVVDFLRAPKFNPLWATHRLLDAIEAG